MALQPYGPEQYQRLWEALRDGREWRGEIQNRKKSGELLLASEPSRPTRRERRNPRYLAIQQDVTEQKHARKLSPRVKSPFTTWRTWRRMALEQDPEGRYI